MNKDKIDTITYPSTTTLCSIESMIKDIWITKDNYLVIRQIKIINDAVSKQIRLSPEEQMILYKFMSRNLPKQEK